MSTSVVSLPNGRRVNTKAVSAYGLAIAVAVVVGLLYALLNLNLKFTLLVVGLAVVAVVVSNPRLALMQFVFVFFINYTLVKSIPLLILDVSAGLVVVAALLDVLSSRRFPQRIPPLTFNYLYIFAALVVCGVFGYWPEAVFPRLAAFGFLIVTFLATYRLTAKVSIRSLINWFFILAVAHSCYNLIPFVTSGGIYRSFGVAGVSFDDLTMIALPIGLSLFLTSDRRRALWYLVGSLIVFGGLVATQSRASIILAVLSCAVVSVVIYCRSRRGSLDVAAGRSVPVRIGLIVLSSVVLPVVAFAVFPDLLAKVVERFYRLVGFSFGGSAAYRVELWSWAWRAFLDHPIFGVGPTGFTRLAEIYPDLRLQPLFIYVRGMSAHNVLFHYLAITGLVGGTGLVALFFNQCRLARRASMDPQNSDPATALVLYGVAVLFFMSIFLEAAWLWRPLSYCAVFYAAMMSRSSVEGSTRMRN